MDSFAGLEQQLQQTADTIQQEAQELQQKLTAKTRDLERVQAAIQALNGKATGKKSSAKKSGGSKKPAPGKEQVLQAMTDLLEENGGVPEADLKSLVEGKLTEAGYSRAGFALRFKESLGDPRFEKSGGQIQLATAPAKPR